jgi:hypothetical protein
VEGVREFLTGAEQGKPSSEAVTERIYVLARESQGQLLLDTCDRARDNLVLHRSYLAR